MTTEMPNSTPATAVSATRTSSYGRYLRMLVCVLTAGFVFPSVFIENLPPQQTSMIAELEDEKKT